MVMGRMPGPGSARAILAAVLAAAAAVTAACGSTHAGQGASGTGAQSTRSPAARASATGCATPSTSAGRMLAFGTGDNGKVLCVAKGTTFAIYLQGTAARRWAPIRTASPALQPVVNGHLMLKLGTTGAFFRAVAPGVATVVSSLPSCGSQAGGAPATSGPRCKMGTAFHLTLVVTQ